MINRYSQQQIEQEDVDAVVKALRSPWLTQGPEVEKFESDLAEFVGARYAVAVCNGTAALHLALWAVRQRMEIDVPAAITSPLSFVATANAALLAGYSVCFEDVDPLTGNAPAAQAGVAMGHVAVPVHFAGRATAIPVKSATVEDACHALGAMDWDGCSRVGSCAHSLATCFSFHPVKPITTGEGGMVTTNDEDLARDLRLLRSHGRDSRGLMQALGLNYRMMEVAAALGRSQLRRCDVTRDVRWGLAAIYDAQLPDVVLPHRGRPEPDFDNRRSAWHLYPVRIKGGRRDEVKAKLQAKGIGVQVHYSPIIPDQPYYVEHVTGKLPPGAWPEARAWAAEELSLPLHAGMCPGDVQAVCEALKEALA